MPELAFHLPAAASSVCGVPTGLAQSSTAPAIQGDEVKTGEIEFALDVHPMPGVPDKLICRWQQRVMAPHGWFWDTLLITTIHLRFEADMRADLQAFSRLDAEERAWFIRRRIRNIKPYTGRLLADKDRVPAAQLQLELC